MAQYECFQRITKESHRKTLLMGKTSLRNVAAKLHYHYKLQFRVCGCGCVPAGLDCNTTWDGWLCWDQTEAGITAEQSCPDYFHDFDPNGNVRARCYDCASIARHAELLVFIYIFTAVASKVCTEEGEWWLHPDSNRTWTNFTICKANNSLHSVRTDSKH